MRTCSADAIPVQISQQVRLRVAADLDVRTSFGGEGLEHRDVPRRGRAQRSLGTKLDQRASEVLVGIARPDERCARPVRGARDLAGEGRVLDLPPHDHELPRLHVDPNPNR